MLLLGHCFHRPKTRARGRREILEVVLTMLRDLQACVRSGSLVG